MATSSTPSSGSARARRALVLSLINGESETPSSLSSSEEQETSLRATSASLTRLDLDAVSQERSAERRCGSWICARGARSASRTLSKARQVVSAKSVVAEIGQAVSCVVLDGYCSDACFVRVHRLVGERSNVETIEIPAASSEAREPVDSAQTTTTPSPQVSFGAEKPSPSSSPASPPKSALRPVSRFDPPETSSAKSTTSVVEKSNKSTTLVVEKSKKSTTASTPPVIARPETVAIKSVAERPTKPPKKALLKPASKPSKPKATASSAPKIITEDSLKQASQCNEYGEPILDENTEDELEEEEEDVAGFFEKLELDTSDPYPRLSLFAASWDVLSRWCTSATKRVLLEGGSSKESVSERLEEEDRKEELFRHLAQTLEVVLADGAGDKGLSARLKRELRDVTSTMDLSRPVPTSLSPGHWQLLTTAVLDVSFETSKGERGYAERLSALALVRDRVTPDQFRALREVLLVEA